MEKSPKILWADDEIDSLRAHILFLKQKGFEVCSVTNGTDAVEEVRNSRFDIVFLDENMPGISGLETLTRIKEMSPSTPVVMITKSEEEHIMEEAIGSKISDYLIKPVNPSQILLACKKILDSRQLVSQKSHSGYQQDFRQIGMQFYEADSFEGWTDIYRRLVKWELELESNPDKTMMDVLLNQQAEANTAFARFVTDNYLDWMNTKDASKRPVLSHDLMSGHVFPEIGKSASVFFILVDCLRYDQWKVFEPLISPYFFIDSEKQYLSILPTATQYARNAIFAGITPYEIAQKFPRIWKNDDDDGGKNLHEADFLQENVSRNRINARFNYHKILKNDDALELVQNHKTLLKSPFNALVYNFIDMLSHSRTEVGIMRELAPNESAYRSLSRSWFEFSPLLDLLKELSKHDVTVIITSDHGSMRVKKPVKIIGDRNTTTNLRYKQGRNLGYDDSRYLFTVKKPEEARLPKTNVSSSYVFTTEDYFFAYPNNYNYYVNYYRDTFQHGGISLEEMVVPLVRLTPKR